MIFSNFNNLNIFNNFNNFNRWVVIRFVANNPGVWPIHCHIEWHLKMGMLAQLVELPSILRSRKVPPEVKNLCSQYNAANSTNH